jgi:hypothetical protein
VLLGDPHHGGAEGGLLDLRRLSAPLGVWAVTGKHECTEWDARAFEDTGFRCCLTAG